MYLTPIYSDYTEVDVQAALSVAKDEKKKKQYANLLEKIQKQGQTLESNLPIITYLKEIDESGLKSTYHISGNTLRYEFYGKHYKSRIAWVEYVIPKEVMLYEQIAWDDKCYWQSCQAIDPSSNEILWNNLQALSGSNQDTVSVAIHEVRLNSQMDKNQNYKVSWVVDSVFSEYWLIGANHEFSR